MVAKKAAPGKKAVTKKKKAAPRKKTAPGKKGALKKKAAPKKPARKKALPRKKKVANKPSGRMPLVGIVAGGFSVVCDVNGVIGTFPDKASANAFKSKHIMDYPDHNVVVEGVQG